MEEQGTLSEARAWNDASASTHGRVPADRRAYETAYVPTESGEGVEPVLFVQVAFEQMWNRLIEAVHNTSISMEQLATNFDVATDPLEELADLPHPKGALTGREAARALVTEPFVTLHDDWSVTVRPSPSRWERFCAWWRGE